jgi:hypothetical protein
MLSLRYWTETWVSGNACGVPAVALCIPVRNARSAFKHFCEKRKSRRQERKD